MMRVCVQNVDSLVDILDTDAHSHSFSDTKYSCRPNDTTATQL